MNLVKFLGGWLFFSITTAMSFLSMMIEIGDVTTVGFVAVMMQHYNAIAGNLFQFVNWFQLPMDFFITTIESKFATMTLLVITPILTLPRKMSVGDGLVFGDGFRYIFALCVFLVLIVLLQIILLDIGDDLLLIGTLFLPVLFIMLVTAAVFFGYTKFAFLLGKNIFIAMFILLVLAQSGFVNITNWVSNI